MTKKIVKITLLKSISGRLKAHKACALGLGLKKIGQTVNVENSLSNMGMINRISYLLKIES